MIPQSLYDYKNVYLSFCLYILVSSVGVTGGDAESCPITPAVIGKRIILIKNYDL